MSLPSEKMKTYGISVPVPTHFRVATCEEVDCDWRKTGWVTVSDEATDLGQRQAHHIRRVAGRPFTESRGADGITYFKFPPGTECFEEHLVRIDREEIYLVRGGDHRGNPRKEIRIHDRPEHWVEDFADHQAELEKGTR